MFSALPQTTGPTPAGMPNFNLPHYYLANTIGGIVGGLASLTAIAWFGMWMGMTSRKTGLPVLKTLGIVVVLLSKAFSAVTGVVLGLSMKFGFPIWLGSMAALLLGLAEDAFFIIWSRHHLLTRHDQVIGASAWSPPLPAAGTGRGKRVQRSSGN